MFTGYLQVFTLELVSKTLGGLFPFLRDWAPGTLTGGRQTFVYAPTVSVPGAKSRKNKL